jgi:hypothetical protein
MLKLIKILPAIYVFGVLIPAHAELRAGNPDMQHCTSNAECTLVSQYCNTSCTTLPLNMSYAQAYTEQRNARCGNQIEQLLNCNVKPALQPACINNRCTVGYAFQNNSDERDLINGGRQPPTRP